MRSVTQHKKRVIWAIALCVVLVGAVYGYATYTSHGRITALYLVVGWNAPSELRTKCEAESRERVETLFLQPLHMTEEAKNGLREYWHYSYYRECLYHAGYSFMGTSLPESRILTEGTVSIYENKLAGTTLEVPENTRLMQDNELDVSFDYRLLRSVLAEDELTVSFDVYTEHQFVTELADVPEYLDHFPASTSTITHTTDHVTSRGIPYLFAYQDDGLCGAIFVAPSGRIIHVYSDCVYTDEIHTLVDTLTFVGEPVSVHE